MLKRRTLNLVSFQEIIYSSKKKNVSSGKNMHFTILRPQRRILNLEKRFMILLGRILFLLLRKIVLVTRILFSLYRSYFLAKESGTF